MTCNVHYAILHEKDSGFDATSYEGIMADVIGADTETILRDVLNFLRFTHPAPYMVVGIKTEQPT